MLYCVTLIPSNIKKRNNYAEIRNLEGAIHVDNLLNRDSMSKLVN